MLTENVMASTIAGIATAVATTTTTTTTSSPAIMASPSMMIGPTLVDVASKLAPMASLVLFVSPIPTIQKIITERSVGNLPLLPYSSMVTNAFVWMIYGLLKHEMSVWISNGIGLILAISYFIQFAKYYAAPSSSKSSPLPSSSTSLPGGTVKQHVQTSLGIVLISTILASTLHGDNAIKFIGTMGVIICLCLFGSPLTTIQTVLRTKSSTSIPLPLSIATTLNCLLWLIVGIFKMNFDYNIIIPNAVGLVFGIIQLSLKIIYSDKKTIVVDSNQRRRRRHLNFIQAFRYHRRRLQHHQYESSNSNSSVTAGRVDTVEVLMSSDNRNKNYNKTGVLLM